MPAPLDEHIFGRPGDPKPDRARHGLHRRPRRRGPLFLVLAVAVLVAGVVFAVTNVKPIYDRWSAPKDFDGEGTGAVTVVVKPGDTGSAIANTLVGAGVIKTAQAFTEALTSTPGDEIQPGSYVLKKEMRASSALSMMRGGGSREVWRVTIREGLWKSEVYTALAQATGIPRAEYEAVDKQAAANPALLGLPPTTKGNPEGWLFPATYSFDKNKKPLDQLKEMVAKTQERLTALGVSAERAERVLIVASLVEAEARRDEDRPKVARVLENRLASSPPMPLQLDSTAAYGVQQRPGKVFTSDEMRGNKNGYNTYAMPGLPVAPIGNAGEAAIKAAVNPVVGTWRYFVTINPDTGETIFTNTLAEHEEQVSRLRSWCGEHPGKC